MAADTPEPASRDRVERVPRALADQLIVEIGSWLDLPDPARVAAVTAAWDSATRAAARRMIAANGLGPAMVRDPVAAPVLAALPDDLRAWLAVQADANQARIDRLHAELADALRALDAAGIPAMPLKGAILTTSGGDPYRRPMADLDLLVRPADREAARAVLGGLGYRQRPEANRRPTHDTFHLPGNERVVSFDGEHPDNPRPIELHVEVRRHLWGWIDDDDLTPYLWAGARPAIILGEPAMMPSSAALLAHLAIHATSDLLAARGRLVQWLDLVTLAELAGVPSDRVGDVVASPGGADVGRPPDHDGEAASPPALEDLPHSRMVLPALRLAMRRFGSRPGAWRPDIAQLEARVPARLAAWASTVPLDTRAGLQSGRLGPRDMSTLEARWGRWAPYRWRLAVAYGDLPLPLSAARHAARVAGLLRPRPG